MTTTDAEPAEPSDQKGTERVLVVDDEPGVRRLMSRLLKVRGYVVHDTQDGPSALQYLETADCLVDLVVTDVVMPGMSGIRLAEAIAARWPQVKLLFVTGYADGETLGSIEATSRPVLCKPFAPAVMAATVRAILEGKAPPAPS
ncbi:MAG TPA: response regulator [Vicinamibacterales bacterium]|nr:response regulator [Vicinamibacterales bacterium]